MTKFNNTTTWICLLLLVFLSIFTAATISSSVQDMHHHSTTSNATTSDTTSTTTKSIASIQTNVVPNTAALVISQLQQIYALDVIQERMPCILLPNCSACTSRSTCCWISGSPANGITVTRSNGDTPLDVREVSFCWSGTFFSAKNPVLDKVPSLKGEETKVSATFAFNDFSSKTCHIRGGVLLVLLLGFAPLSLVMIMLSLFISLICCMIRLRTRLKTRTINVSRLSASMTQEEELNDNDYVFLEESQSTILLNARGDGDDATNNEL